ncbi:secreted protein [Streptomyces viridosporus ATCC 14672]|uniref:Secreted protein n=1 Tax=Streptomyces viridosporus (strain ATCC 14672 / DSM 40746 / JCM 4963 / KCTC 9882 / NRRL B-12104 / FH 1290) TaxID=566461 RepID=D5ZYA7_STRV1|nr:secreted protein [Streptomyces viridosporus ATCC 14672]
MNCPRGLGSSGPWRGPLSSQIPRRRGRPGAGADTGSGPRPCHGRRRDRPPSGPAGVASAPPRGQIGPSDRQCPRREALLIVSRIQSFVPAVAGAVLLVPMALPAAAAPQTRAEPAAWRATSVSAAELLAEVRDCAPVSQGRYRKDHGSSATVPVCGTHDAVFWKADMDIDCDGRPGRHCNVLNDPYFSAATAFAQSDGRPLSSEDLPFVVVPAPSAVWDYRAHGVRGGSVVAVVYQDRVQYGVVGDTGPADVIGEASYAMAEALGINPDPRSGGAPSGVTYIVFKDSRATPIEDHRAAVTEGERLARQFVNGG